LTLKGRQHNFIQIQLCGREVMELRARSIDGFLAYWCGIHEVRGEVHSVFQKTLNIKTSGGQLISILSLADLDGPNTVVAELPQGEDFITMGLRSGMPVRLDSGEADLGEGALSLRIGKAHRWWPRLADSMQRLDLKRLTDNMELLLRSLPREEVHQGLGRLLFNLDKIAAGQWHLIEDAEEKELVRLALPGIRDLWQGALECDEELLKTSLNELLGLGTGLTPAGDDLLLGFVGTLSVVSRRVGGPEVERLLDIIRQHLSSRKDRTTFISSNLLAYACAGRISAPILSVIRALLFEEIEAVRSAARTLVRQGAGSGSEILLGILLALSLMPRLCES
jgi:hypothetical protein